MGQYGNAAKIALDKCKTGLDPESAWREGCLVSITSEKSRQKGCPRNAFLGLCDKGIVPGVKAGRYCNSEDNKRYAITAICLLRKEPQLQYNVTELWRRVLKEDKNDPIKQHNGQMDVAIAVFKELLK